MKIHTIFFLFLSCILFLRVKGSEESNIANLTWNCGNNAVKKITQPSTHPYDIVINEIMADPYPTVGLPDAEYIELLNTTDLDITALDWKMIVGDKVIPLPFFHLEKHAYLLICEAGDSILLNPYGTILPVLSLPALNNEGQTLTLTDMENNVIHSVSYSEKWYGNSLKSEGGWSLEIADPENPCGRQENWAASDHNQGGTPGCENSIYRSNPDIQRPLLLRAATTSDSCVLVSFSEPILVSSISDPFAYSVDRNVFHPSVAESLPPDFSSVRLSFPRPFNSFLTYELMVKNSVCDCVGNALADSYTEFGLASLPDSFDLVINEVLFDAPGDEEFVEIFNRSDRIIELASLSLVLMDGYTGDFTRKLYEFKWNFQLLPGQFVVITGNAPTLQQHYNCKVPAAVIEADDILNLPDKEGALALVRNSSMPVDCFFYDADYHFEPITDPEGISLERIFADYPTNDPDNWHSAAQDAGFATPGYKNSQSFLPAESPASSVWTEPEVFTPDNDGNDDVLSVFYRLEVSGSLANVIIFDSRGKLVRRLVNNDWLGTEGFLTWDGTNTIGALEKAGIYVIYTEILSEKGTVKKYTSTCVLSKDLK